MNKNILKDNYTVNNYISLIRTKSLRWKVQHQVAKNIMKYNKQYNKEKLQNGKTIRCRKDGYKWESKKHIIYKKARN